MVPSSDQSFERKLIAWYPDDSYLNDHYQPPDHGALSGSVTNSAIVLLNLLMACICGIIIEGILDKE
jgi:hypothetical protein